jgi:hypothetical protein
MDVRAIIASVPLLRRIWRVLPGPLRVPLLLVGVAVGIWYLVSGRHKDADGPPAT